MPNTLPAWIVSNEESVRREAARYRAMTPEDRLELVFSACEDAITILAMQEDPQRALDWVDPLPPSSVAVLARLRGRCR